MKNKSINKRKTIIIGILCAGVLIITIIIAYFNIASSTFNKQALWNAVNKFNIDSNYKITYSNDEKGNNHNDETFGFEINKDISKSITINGNKFTLTENIIDDKKLLFQFSNNENLNKHQNSYSENDIITFFKNSLNITNDPYKIKYPGGLKITKIE